MPTINTRGSVSAKAFGFGANAAVTGQQAYTTTGTFSWTCPVGVTSVSVVCVGPGSNNGAAGGLGYKNNYSVIPGNSYTVVVGGPTSQVTSYFVSTALVSGVSGVSGTGGGHTGDGGGNGGNPGYDGINYGGGGGAGGYSGNGGDGGASSSGYSGSGGGGGGGGAESSGTASNSGGGGGVGILGQGSNGAGGSFGSPGGGGGGGSGGVAGVNGGKGGDYGGGSGTPTSVASQGAVRIIGPGNTRQFPSTNTGNL